MTLPDMWKILLRHGWSSIPVRQRGKQPALKSWSEYQSAHASTAEVERWAARGYNAGIVTGAISRLLVLDLDSAAAIAEAERRGLPETVTASTAKGRHHYFAHPGGRIKNRAGILPGIDIRADGGFVVAPGSIHPSGVPYTWRASPDDTPLSAPPTWLIDMLTVSCPARPPIGPQEAHRARSLPVAGECSPYVRIPTKPATYSGLKPATVPI